MGFIIKPKRGNYQDVPLTSLKNGEIISTLDTLNVFQCETNEVDSYQLKNLSGGQISALSFTTDTSITDDYLLLNFSDFIRYHYDFSTNILILYLQGSIQYVNSGGGSLAAGTDKTTNTVFKLTDTNLGLLNAFKDNIQINGNTYTQFNVFDLNDLGFWGQGLLYHEVTSGLFTAVLSKPINAGQIVVFSSVPMIIPMSNI